MEEDDFDRPYWVPPSTKLNTATPFLRESRMLVGAQW
jgi:hypothetical protein